GILFLQREYEKALAVLDRVCQVDPEDLQMHYTAMLCHRGLGHAEMAEREERLFRRFKADEPAQAITATRRLLSPEENNERQQIHEHDSVSIAPTSGVSPRERPSPSNAASRLPQRGATRAPRRR